MNKILCVNEEIFGISEKSMKYSNVIYDSEECKIFSKIKIFIFLRYYFDNVNNT